MLGMNFHLFYIYYVGGTQWGGYSTQIISFDSLNNSGGYSDIDEESEGQKG